MGASDARSREFDREWERATLDRENVAHEQEELKHIKTSSSPRPRPSKTPRGHHRYQMGPLILKLKTANTPKAGGIAEQPPLLLRGDPTASQIRLIFIREINMIILKERLRSSSASKISTCFYRSESRRQRYRITADSASSQSMLPTPPSLRAYCRVNFQRNS